MKAHCSQLGLVAQRITRLTTDQKIAGSNPAEIDQQTFLKFFPDNLYFKTTGRGKYLKCKSKTIGRPRVGSNHQPFG